jgi:predicted kinase
MKAILISADDLKKTIPDYDPDKSELVHHQSTKLADKLYADTLKSSDYKKVILMSGGSASGKTEFMSEYLANRPVIIFDGTLQGIEGAKMKIQLAKKYGKQISVVAIWPENFKIAFAAFSQRDRKYPDEYFYKTHSSSRKTLLEIAKSGFDIDIQLYENTYKKDGLLFYEYAFDSKEHLIEEITDNQYTEEEIINVLTDSE